MKLWSLPASWSTVSRCPGICVQFGGYVSRNKGCRGHGHMQWAPCLFGRTRPWKEVRSCVCHRHFCILIFLYGILFDARGESCMWPSQTPVSVVTPPSCVWASLIQLIIFHIRSVHGTLWLSAWRTEIPFVSTIYCLHNTGFWFVRLVVVYWVYLLLHERLQSHFIIAMIWKVWYGKAGGWKTTDYMG